MSQSRFDKIGTIYSRVSFLLQHGVIPVEFKPLWFDIYKTFPPKYEPRFDRPHMTDPLPKILYPEDRIRARYHAQFGSKMEVYNVVDSMNEGNATDFKPYLSDTFINKYQSVHEEMGVDDGPSSGQIKIDVFAESVKRLEDEDGIDLKMKYEETNRNVSLKPLSATLRASTNRSGRRGGVRRRHDDNMFSGKGKFDERMASLVEKDEGHVEINIDVEKLNE